MMVIQTRAELHRLAMAAGQDAGNRSARKSGHTAWSEEDWNIAAAEAERILGTWPVDTEAVGNDAGGYSGRTTMQPTPACTCDGPAEFGDGRHEPDCLRAPDLAGWLFYPHDGELEDGGVYVHPTDQARIYLLASGMLIPVDAEDYTPEHDHAVIAARARMLSKLRQYVAALPDEAEDDDSDKDPDPVTVVLRETAEDLDGIPIVHAVDRLYAALDRIAAIIADA
jgi:hypothetical protein